MAHIINLASSSSPSCIDRHQSPLKIGRNSRENSIINISSPVSNQMKKFGMVGSSSLSQIVQQEDYENFKKEWQKNRLSSSEEDNEIDNDSGNEMSKTSLSQFFKSPIGIKKRRASDTFRIIDMSSPRRRDKVFKNKMEAINSIRLFMSESMAAAYEGELRRRFNDRLMSHCIHPDSSNIIIPSEMASFGWKFLNSSLPSSHPDAPEDFVRERIFVIDSDMIWEEYIATRRYDELLKVYNEPDVLLFFINWRRASQRHTSALNKQFKQSLNNENGAVRLIPANQLENEFFLSAAKLRLQVNFSSSSNQTSSIVELMDFIIEATRVIALKYYLKGSESSSSSNSVNLNLTVSKDVKVKCGKDPKDSWSKILSQIPRVTPQIAYLISSKYPSFASLMEEYERLNEEEGRNLLAELRFDETRRLGPVISSRIFDHFRR